jgi:hypothetical protein
MLKTLRHNVKTVQKQTISSMSLKNVETVITSNYKLNTFQVVYLQFYI